MTLPGCATTSNTGQGALFGGLFGAGTGAVIGHAMGNTGAGAAIGAGAGALTGAAVGSNMDEQDARARAAADQARAQQAAAATAAAVTVPDVVAMTQARVDESVIIDRIHSHGIVAPLQTNDVIYLHQQGVSANVITAMQTQPVATAAPPGQYYYYAPPEPVYVSGGCYYDHPHYYGPRVGIGFGWR
jgi:hypothetical protein